ncbi:MAG TPA: hypothetical protein VF603_06255 [Allosphingosinicella sp.]|jgi:hypothetical protein
MAKRDRDILKRAVAGAIFALSLALPVRAVAGDVAELDCAVAGLTAADGAALIQPHAAGDAPPSAAVQTLVACARRFEWTREEFAAAAHYIPSYLGRINFSNVLQGHGLDLDRIARDVLADAALIGAAVELRRDPPELRAFMQRLLPTLGSWPARHGRDRASLEALGGFVAATALAEGARRRFSRY